MSICPINYFVAKSSASSFAATVQSHYPLFSIDFMMRVIPCMRWFFEQNTDEGITFFDYILFYRPLGKQQDRIRRVEQESRILFHWIPSSYVYLKPALEERERQLKGKSLQSTDCGKFTRWLSFCWTLCYWTLSPCYLVWKIYQSGLD